MKFVHMLAEIKEFKQSQEVAACLLTMRAEQQRLSTLENYLEDYQSEGLEKGISHQAEAVRTEHVFVQTLSHAVSEQSERLEALQGQLASHLGTWRNAKAKVNSLNQSIGRVKGRQKLRRARREQAALDETGARAALTTPKPGG